MAIMISPGVNVIDEGLFVRNHLSLIDANQRDESRLFTAPYKARIKKYMELKGIADLNELRRIFPPIKPEPNPVKRR